MQQPSAINRLPRRILPGVALFCTLFSLFSTPGHSALAKERLVTETMQADLQPQLLLALVDTPKFLVIAPVPSADTGEKREEEEGKISPFFGSDQALTFQSPPERPAIASNDEITLERPEFTAGVHVNMGSLKFNLGYTLPSSQLDNFVRPLGVDLDAGADIKRFSLAVKVPF